MATLVSTNSLDIKINKSNKPFSPRLVNWVEPVTVSGYIKTCIYTEVDSGLKVGERVFIINGNYDSDILIKSNKYKKGRDGYKVLSVDKCKIVLDIDFTGVLPWNEDTIDNFIRIYPINDQTEFDYVNKIYTTENGYLDYRFNFYNDNIIFSKNNYTATVANYGQNGGLLGSPGFFIRNGTSTWLNVTNDFLGDFPLFESTYTSMNSNSRVKIMNGSFTHGGVEFKEGFVYKYENNKWVVDVTYFRPIISKSNFRDGNFEGSWSSGVYGRQDKKIKWVGENSTWNNGTLVNTVWEKGSMSSNITSDESYFSTINEFGLPFQKINTSNNRGFGYNYILDSEIKSSSISNGNFYNTLLGTQSATFSVVESFILSSSDSLNIDINTGEFNSCSFESTTIRNSEIRNSRISNSRAIKTKSINSHFIESLFYGSKFNSENIIKILKYDRWSVDSNGTMLQLTNIYKFYISEDNYERLKHKDQFYINGIIGGRVQSTQETSDLLNFFDRKFILNNYIYRNDEISYPGGVSKKNTQYTVNLSTSNENKFTISGNSISGTNSNYLPSIDIHILDDKLSFLDIDITNAFIIDSDFRSGLFEKSDWNSGNLINHNYDSVIPNLTNVGGSYNISITNPGGNKLTVIMPTSDINDNLFKIGSIVYLNSIDQIDVNYNVTELPDTYKISNIVAPRTLVLEEVGTSIISGLTTSIGFSTYLNGTSSQYVGNRYNYIHPVKVNNSNVKSGVFRRTYIKNSLIYNQDYNNRDYDFKKITNVRSLITSEMIYRNANNNFNSGTHVYSFMTNGSDSWKDGIFYNSVWCGQTFSNGVFKSSRWEDGVFQNGLFYKSNAKGGTSILTPNYQSEKIKSYWRRGDISLASNFNNRYSWMSGSFNGGEFYKSGWESGYFNTGKFYLSDWFNGTFSDGVIGDVSLSPTDTNFYSGVFQNGTVENANLFAKNTSYISASVSTSPVSITWNNGIFKSGVFGSTIRNSFGGTEYSTATWNNGVFNGGEFISNANWKNGTFNNGKFISSYGWTMSTSTFSTNYTWENGAFNGGEFGLGDKYYNNYNDFYNNGNSTWYTGEFNGGKFKGRVWNNGVFTSGDFEGSSTYSSISPFGTTCSNPNAIVQSYGETGSNNKMYHGLWRNGTFTDVKDKFIKDKKIFTEIYRKHTERIPIKKATIKNALWTSGIFSHPSGEMNNCVWLDGAFSSGKFIGSSFNPYVKRNGSTQSTFNLNDNTCYWENGTLDNSDFYISKWNDGKFLVGTATGMIWKNGVSNYMNAFNIFWEDGTWRNGNWYGSSFVVPTGGVISDDYTKQIIFRGMSWSGTSSCHIWNIFTSDENTAEVAFSFTASTVSVVGGGGGGGGGA